MKRDFCIGSEWVYYKIYTGVKMADIILLEKLYPVISMLKQNTLIDKWFFIRYKDTDEHIRMRLHCTSIEMVSTVINSFYPVFNELIESDIIWKLQTDTYQREIERYGENTIIESESLFYFDSEMIVEYLAIKPYFINEETQLLFSFLVIDNFLNSFLLNNTDKLKLMNELQLSFKKEFQADKLLKKQFDKHYRELSNDIYSYMTKKSIEEYSELYDIVNNKNKNTSLLISAIRNNLQISLFDFLQSHIHMTINRQYTSRQRQYECLIYDHLYRYYKSVEFRPNRK